MNKKPSFINKLLTYSPNEIKALRKKHNLTQTALAKLINTNHATISKWESGEKILRGPALKLLNLLDKRGVEFLLDDEL